MVAGVGGRDLPRGPPLNSTLGLPLDLTSGKPNSPTDTENKFHTVKSIDAMLRLFDRPKTSDSVILPVHHKPLRSGFKCVQR